MRHFLIVCLALLLPSCSLNRVAGTAAEPPAATQTCPDASVIRANESCPLAPPPPPPAPTANGHSGDPLTRGERDYYEESAGPIGFAGPSPSPRPLTARLARAAPASRSAQARPAFPATDADADPATGIEEGKGAFIKPPPMFVGSAGRLIFAVAPDEARIRAALGNREVGETTDILISPIMQVDLVPDANFDFIARSKARIPLGVDRRATWLWDVIPKKRGKFMLTAKVQVFRNDVAVDEYDSYVDVSVRVGRREAVKEEIGFLRMFGEELGGLFGSWQQTLLAFAALIAAGFTVWKVIKNRGAST